MHGERIVALHVRHIGGPQNYGTVETMGLCDAEDPMKTDEKCIEVWEITKY